ncbi:MAG: protein kinase [Deltaproteobacteria bacterium]|nr:protein kinase [Deltaproteobacteria bacterium]
MEGKTERDAVLRPGERVDAFQVIRLIGRGGMGEVYLARDTTLGRKVALKMVHPARLGSDEMIQQFLFEARTTARFSHPHIVTVFAAGQHRDRPYLALEYLEGRTLRQRMREDWPALPEVLRFGQAIAEALAEAHAHGVLHRDLKPENVLIPRDGRLRVVDFGLARPIDAGDLGRATETAKQRKKAIGTPAYMAPELWRGRPASQAADVWALGVVLYELAAGQRPYTDSRTVDLVARLLAAEPVPAVSSLAAVPQDLAALIHACLDKDPDARPRAAEVGRSLEQMLHRRRDRPADQQPFQGLMPFGERQAEFFFGRERELSAFLERLRDTPVLPLVGPSGVGKSSFVRAGVVPRLREQGSWTVLSVRPGSRPFANLAAKLLGGETSRDSTPGRQRPDLQITELDAVPTINILPAEMAREEPDADTLDTQQNASGDRSAPRSSPDRLDALDLEAQLFDRPGSLAVHLLRIAEQESSRVLLFVDQLEELHTLVEDEKVRARYMRCICSAADDPEGPVRVVFTLREDFLGRLALGSEAREALSRVTVMRSPSREEMVDILIEPLRVLGYAYDDPAMVEEMIDSVAGEPTPLPLLQFAGQVLWSRRDRAAQLVRRSVYDAMGGVPGALAEHADGILEGLTQSEVQLVRMLLLRLVTSDRARRMVERQQALDGLGAGAEKVLQRLTAARLVSVAKSGPEGEACLELVHESLIHTWARLARWIDESQEEIRFLSEIEQAARLWERRGRREDEVWEGEALEEASRGLARCRTEVPELLSAFLEAGRRRQRRRVRRRGLVVAAGALTLAVVAVGSLLGGIELAEKENEARQQKVAAEKQLAEAMREGARRAMLQGDVMEARAKLRSSLEAQDSALARMLWQQLSGDELVWRHRLGSTVYGVDLSPDGRLAAVACGDRSVHLFDMQTGQPLQVLHGHADQVLRAAFDPSGQRLASSSWDGKVLVWELGAGAERPPVRSVQGQHEGAVWGLGFSPDGRFLATAGMDGSLRIWDAATGAAVQRVEAHSAAVLHLAFGPGGDRIATSSRDGSVRLWAFGPRLEPRMRFAGQGWGKGLSSRFSPDGRHLATGWEDGWIRVFRLPDGSPGTEIAAHRAGIWDLAFSADGRQLASGSRDRSARLWSFDPGSEVLLPVRRFDAPSAAVLGLRFDPSGQRLISVGYDNKVRVWDLERPGKAADRSGHADPVLGLSFSPDGRLLASSSYDKTVRLWDVRSGELQRVLSGHPSAVWGLDFSPDGRTLASGGSDRCIRLWDVAQGVEQRALVGHRDLVNDVRFHPGGRILASASEDRTVRIWDAEQGLQLQVLEGHRNGVYDLSFSPGGRSLASSSEDGTVRIWLQGPDGRYAPGKVLRPEDGSAEGVCFSPDGRSLVSSSENKRLWQWDPSSGERRLVKQLPGRVYWIDFHPDGKRIAAPCSDRKVWLVDLLTGEARSLRGHRAEVNLARFSRDGSLLATSSDDGTVRMWRVADGRPLWWAQVTVGLQVISQAGWSSLFAEHTRAGTGEGGQRWRAVSQAARLSAPAPDGSLCLYTFDGELQMWNTPEDRLLWRRSAEGRAEPERLLVLHGACIVMAGGKLLRIDAQGRDRTLVAEGVSAASLDGDELLVASGARLLTVDPQTGDVRAEVQTAAGVTAVARMPEAYWLGYSSGSIEIVSRRTGRMRTDVSFEEPPSRPVLQFCAGPMQTLIAGYADGFVGVWDLASGCRLASSRLHGPIIHLQRSGGRVAVVSELGGAQLLDLRVLTLDRCRMLRRVWESAPVLWEAGRPVQREAPADHPCSPVGEPHRKTARKTT